MNEREAEMRHELANWMTTITILVADSGLKPAEKQPIEDRVRMACKMLAYEKIFLGEAQSFFRESVDVVELLRILCGVFGQSQDVGGLERRLPSAPLRVLADRSALADALELIFRKWILSTIPLDFEVDASGGRLVFRHPSGVELSPKNSDLLEMLRSDSGSPEWGFQLALRLLEMNGVQINFTEREMALTFNRERK